MFVQNDGTAILVPRFWHQDPGGKILVPKTESLRGSASQKSARERGGLQAARQESGGLEATQEQQEVWGAAVPQ